MTVGNHELEGGPDALYGVLANAITPGAQGSFPLLSANMHLENYSALGQWIQPATMKTIGGIKVGIFGLTVPDNPTEQTAGQGGSVALDPDVFGIAARIADSLKNKAHADVVICLSHLGFQYDQPLAANVPYIDVIVGGHDHYIFDKPVRVSNPTGGTTLILQAGPYYEHIGKLTLEVTLSSKGTRVTMKKYALLEVDRQVCALPKIQAIVNDVKTQVVAK